MTDINEKKVLKALEKVMDPEIGISIVDLGLIYKVKVNKNKVHITMTLTTIGCPLVSFIQDEMLTQLGKIGFNKNSVFIEVTFDPPWSIDKVSEKGKVNLGIG